MLLLNGERAIVDIKKLRDYCLNPNSPRGKGKARVCLSALGLGAVGAAKPREKLLEVARTGKAQLGELDTIDFEMETEAGKVIVRSGWIILYDESVPRLTTYYVEQGKKY